MSCVNVNEAYCFKCQKTINEDELIAGYKCTNILEDGSVCGSHMVVLGNNHKRNDKGGIVCICPEGRLKKVMHMDFKSMYKDVWQCQCCGNSVTTDTYR